MVGRARFVPVPSISFPVTRLGEVLLYFALKSLGMKNPKSLNWSVIGHVTYMRLCASVG